MRFQERCKKVRQLRMPAIICCGKSYIIQQVSLFQAGVKYLYTFLANYWIKSLINIQKLLFMQIFEVKSVKKRRVNIFMQKQVLAPKAHLFFIILGFYLNLLTF